MYLPFIHEHIQWFIILMEIVKLKTLYYILNTFRVFQTINSVKKEKKTSDLILPIKVDEALQVMFIVCSCSYFDEGYEG